MDIQSGWYKIENLANNQVMAVGGGDANREHRGVQIITFAWQNGDEQKFRISRLDDGSYRIEPKHTHKYGNVVAIGGGDPANKQESAFVIQWDWLNSPEQKFQLTWMPEKKAYLIKNLNSGRVLAMVNEIWPFPSSVRQGSYVAGADNQLWKLTCIEPLVPQGSIPWGVQLHMGDTLVWEDKDKPNYSRLLERESLDEAKRAFRLIKQLGATYLRTGYDWAYVERDRGKPPNKDRLRFFREYTDVAVSEGFKKENVIGILYGLPEWVNRRLSDAELVQCFENYTREVATSLKGLVGQFQIWNEPNNTMAEQLAPNSAGPRSPRTYSEIFFRADRALRKVLRDDYQSGWINIHCFSLYWSTLLQVYFQELHDKGEPHRINIGIDHYPGTWSNEGGLPPAVIEGLKAPETLGEKILLALKLLLTTDWARDPQFAPLNSVRGAQKKLGLSSWIDWSPLDTVAKILRDNPYCRGRKVSILETGFSTPPDPYPHLFRNHTESNQREWICGTPLSALPDLYAKIHELRQRYQDQDLVSFCTWYVLYDHATGGGENPIEAAEYNFGIMHSDKKTTKAGFNQLAKVIEGFTNGTLVV